MSIEVFGRGIHNVAESDKIKPGSSSDSLGWVTKDTSIELARGAQIQGVEVNGLSSVEGHITTERNDGQAVHLKKVGTVIMYLDLDDSTWKNVVTGLTDGAWYDFNEYSSNAGLFIYVTGVDGCWKIPAANLDSAVDMTHNAKSPTGTVDYGHSIISSSRMFCFNLEKNPSALYLSYIDSINYTDVAAEAIGSSGSTNYTGTLATVTGRKTCHDIVITDGTQTLVDDNNGGFTGDGTGTINYATGAYNVTFTATTTGSVTADYSTEDSSDGGIVDFTFTSPTRGAGEGDVIPQSSGGVRIQNVIPLTGKYYSIKDRSVYELDLTIDDTNATNLVYNAHIGSLFHKSSIATSLGIVFMDTSNPDLPKLTRLQFDIAGDKLTPNELAPHFDFSKYVWDQCYMKTYGEDIVFTGKANGSTYNNRLFRWNSRLNSVDVHPYRANTLQSINGILYGGDSISENVQELFTGFDDNNNVIDNYWDSNNERFKTSKLKRYKWQELKGFISIDQSYEVYAIYDDGDEELVATISGTGEYVDQAQSISVGSTEVGSSEVGGGTSGITAYYYNHEFKIRTPKFGKRKLRFKAIGVGFASISFIDEKEVQLSGSSRRVPKKYRVS